MRDNSLSTSQLFDPSGLDNGFAALGSEFSSEVIPQGLSEPRLVDVSPQTAQLLGLDPKQLSHDSELSHSSEELLALASGHRLLGSHKPLAMVYSGHQFGVYVPQLGDGRAMLLGQVRGEQGIWDIQLKGAGMTPYSRQGDGRAVLRSTIREYLCSEAMHGLGIATTRALALATSDDPVYREQVEPAATLVRVARSHIRFGSFEYFHYTGRHAELKQLADYVIATHHPDLADDSNRYSEFFRRVVLATAQMIAHWQAVGFAHGVMNTDNMSILGDTIDYGPFGFLDQFEPGFICNHSDHTGRYSFDRQPGIALWNLNALAHALSSLIDSDNLKAALQLYEPEFLEQFFKLMRGKLGLATVQADDGELIDELMSVMKVAGADYTRFFRQLCDWQMTNDKSALTSVSRKSQTMNDWLQRYRDRLQNESTSAEQRAATMKSCNPKFVLRNYMAEIAIRKAEDQQDYSEVQALRQLLSNPYDEHPDWAHYAQQPPEWSKDICVSCSS